jgi:hypothetical protein
VHPALPLLEERGQPGSEGVDLLLWRPRIEHALDLPNGVDDLSDDLARRHFV